MKYRINVTKVKRQAGQIEENGSDLNALIREIDTLEQDCRRVWKGQAADEFLTKLEQLKNNMKRTRRQITSLSETIRSCADRIQKEDEEQERIAQALKGSGGGGGSGW